MTYGTVQSTWLTRVGARYTALESAWKAAPPAPAQLYPPSPGQSFSPISWPGWDAYERQAQNNSVDERNAKIAVQSAWVYRNINAIARELSVATLQVKRLKPGAEDEDIQNHPLELLWEKPNEFMGRSFLMQFWAWQLLLSGEAYLYLCPVGEGRYEIWPVPSWMMEPAAHEKEFIDAYLFKAGPQAQTWRIPRELIIYSRLPNPFDIRRGLSPLVAAMVEVTGDLAMARWNTNYFDKENATPTGVIAVPRDTLDPDLARIRLEIQDFFGQGKRRVAVARAGDLTWTAFQTTQKDMEFLAGREFTSKLIDTIFGIPEGFWSKDATRANSEGAKATMIENAVWPHLVLWAEDWNSQGGLMLRDDERASFDDIRPRNRSMELQEFGAYQTVRVLNELRAMIGDKPLDDPRGLMLVAEINKGTPLPATPAAEETEAYIAEQEAAVAEEAPEEEGDILPEEDAALPPEEEGELLPVEEEEVSPVKHINWNAVNLLREWRTEDAAAVDLGRWERKALKGLKRFGKAAVNFESLVIPLPEQERIIAGLRRATTVEEVKAVFHGHTPDLHPDAAWMADDFDAPLSLTTQPSVKGWVTLEDGRRVLIGGGGGGTGGGGSSSAMRFENAKDADNWARGEFGQWGNGLNAKERTALMDYQNHDFEGINGGLRSGRLPGKYNTSVKALDSALSQKTLPHDMELYRGMDMSSDHAQAVVDSWEPGSTFQDKGYLSTSLDKHMAHNVFVESNGPKATITVRAPKGTHAGYMNAASNNHMMAYEQEMLLPRNTNYRVISKTNTGNGVHVELEVVP